MASLPDEMIGFIGEVSLNNGHRGLAEIAKQQKVDVTTLKPGQFLGFINRSATNIKVFAANGVILHYKAEHGRLLTNDQQGLIPAFMAGGMIRYKKKLEDALIAYVTGVKEQEATRRREAKEKAVKRKRR